MTVNEQTFTDVAFGEVWLAGGQSNMEFMLKDAKNGAAELAQCADSNVRYFSVPRNTFRDDAYKAAMDAAHWELPSPETSGTCRLPAIWQQRSWRRPWAFPWGSSAAISAALR